MIIEVIEGHSVPVGEEYLAENYPSSGAYLVNRMVFFVDKTNNLVYCLGDESVFKSIATETPTEDKSGTVSEDFALKLTATILQNR